MWLPAVMMWEESNPFSFHFSPQTEKEIISTYAFFYFKQFEIKYIGKKDGSQNKLIKTVFAKFNQEKNTHFDLDNPSKKINSIILSKLVDVQSSL